MLQNYSFFCTYANFFVLLQREKAILYIFLTLHPCFHGK